MKLVLKLMAIIGSINIKSKGEIKNNAIHKIEAISVRMPVLNFKGAESDGVIDDRILKKTYGLGIAGLEFYKFYILLDMTRWDLLFIPLGLYRSFPNIAR
jgi:hypothetical protein